MSQFNQRNKRNRAPFPEFLIKAEFKTKFHAQIRKIQFVLRNIIQLSAAHFLCLKGYGINSFKIIDLAIVQYIFLSILRFNPIFSYTFERWNEAGNQIIDEEDIFAVSYMYLQ